MRQNSCLKKKGKYSSIKQFFENDLKDVNKEFFEEYKHAFEKKRFVEKTALKQGDINRIDENENIFDGTLGCFVTNQVNFQTKYALICNHVFPMRNLRDYDAEYSEIGTCIYSTGELSIDFKAIEINETIYCNVSLR